LGNDPCQKFWRAHNTYQKTLFIAFLAPHQSESFCLNSIFDQAMDFFEENHQIRKGVQESLWALGVLKRLFVFVHANRLSAVPEFMLCLGKTWIVTLSLVSEVECGWLTQW